MTQATNPKVKTSLSLSRFVVDRGRIKESLIKARLALQTRSHEEKSEAARKAAARRDPKEFRASLAKAREASQARSPAEKSAAARKAVARRDPSELRRSLERARLVAIKKKKEKTIE